jgi:hypothetical protein
MTDDMASLQAALAAAFDAGQVLRELDSISVDQPLATRLVETVHALDAYYERIRAGGDALLHSVEALTRDAGTTGETRTGSHMSPDDLRAIDRMPDIRQAVAGVFAPDQGHLRLPAATLADIFLRVVPFAARTPDPRHSPPLPAEQVVDLFLYGVAIR